MTLKWNIDATVKVHVLLLWSLNLGLQGCCPQICFVFYLAKCVRGDRYCQPNKIFSYYNFLILQQLIVSTSMSTKIFGKLDLIVRLDTLLRLHVSMLTCNEHPSYFNVDRVELTLWLNAQYQTLYILSFPSLVQISSTYLWRTIIPRAELRVKIVLA